MSLSNNVIDLNNLALLYMRQGGHHADTLAALGAALSYLRLAKSCDAVVGIHHPAAVDFIFSMSSGCIIKPEESPFNKPVKNLLFVPILSYDGAGEPCTRTISCMMDEANVKLFNQGLTIPCLNNLIESQILQGVPPRQMYDIMMAMILYNMGLSLHINGLRTGLEHELVGALGLYELSLGVLKEHGNSIDAESLLMLLLALMSNVHSIRSGRFADAESNDEFLNWIRFLANNPQFRAFMENNDYSTLFQNLVVALSQIRGCSPAA